jgi:phage baseplate assembly protein W
VAQNFTKFRGFSFPFRKGGAGFPEAAIDDDLVRDSLQQIVMTGPGERVMRPTFGCRARELVFANNSPAVVTIAARVVAQAIRDHEPRASLLDIQLSQQDVSIILLVIYAVNGRVQPPLLVPLE